MNNFYNTVSCELVANQSMNGRHPRNMTVYQNPTLHAKTYDMRPDFADKTYFQMS